MLRPNATQFIVLEAKIGSRLSRGTTNAIAFNQAARNVACIAHALWRAQRAPDEVECGFYVFAPERAIAPGSFQAALDRESSFSG